MGKIKPYNVHYSMSLLFSVRTEFRKQEVYVSILKRSLLWSSQPH